MKNKIYEKCSCGNDTFRVYAIEGELGTIQECTECPEHEEY